MEYFIHEGYVTSYSLAGIIKAAIDLTLKGVDIDLSSVFNARGNYRVNISKQPDKPEQAMDDTEDFEALIIELSKGGIKPLRKYIEDQGLDVRGVSIEDLVLGILEAKSGNS